MQFMSMSMDGVRAFVRAAKNQPWSPLKCKSMEAPRAKVLDVSRLWEVVGVSRAAWSRMSQRRRNEAIARAEHKSLPDEGRLILIAAGDKTDRASIQRSQEKGYGYFRLELPNGQGIEFAGDVKGVVLSSDMRIDVSIDGVAKFDG